MVRSSTKPLPESSKFHLTLNKTGTSLRILITAESGEAVSLIDQVDTVAPKEKIIVFSSGGSPEVVSPKLITEEGCKN